jgi:nucleotide-binding universal stress UspA family protein
MASRPIVVGTDGSSHALSAVEWAAREATDREDSLRIVSPPWAWPISTPSGNLTFAVSSDVSDADHAAANLAAAAAADRAAELFPGLRVESDIVPGSPVEVLLGCAATASMLVVGSRGAGGFAAMMLGSVSRCIATNAACAAVVVRGDARPDRRVVASASATRTTPQPRSGSASRKRHCAAAEQADGPGRRERIKGVRGRAALGR